jgi:hypothetical protein
MTRILLGTSVLSRLLRLRTKQIGVEVALVALLGIGLDCSRASDSPESTMESEDGKPM